MSLYSSFSLDLLLAILYVAFLGTLDIYFETKPPLGFALVLGSYALWGVAYRDVTRRLDAHIKRIRKLEEELASCQQAITRTPNADERIRLP